MADLTRLREIVRASVATRQPLRELTYVPESRAYAGPPPADLAARMGAVTIETAAGPCLVVERRYDLSDRYGDVTLGDCVVRDGPAFRRFTQSWSAPQADADEKEAGAEAPVMFVDLETTGLSGGAGTCAFLVGCGFFENEAFVTRQFFLSTYAAERAQLAAVTDWLSRCAAIVTYNGKTFDLPVMEMRWSFHRMDPLAGKPHLDMLHPARCLWKGRNGADHWGPTEEDPSRCSLGALEKALFGVRRYDDVPGFEIPSRYFHFIRTGDPAPLEPVLEHNRLDLLSLAALTARALALVNGGPSAAVDMRECLALGRVYERARETDRALDCYRCVAGIKEDRGGMCAGPFPSPHHGDPDRETIAEALRRLAVHFRRERRHQDAAAMWARILDLGVTARTTARAAAEALAVHHEHRVRDLESARTFALRALEADPQRQRDIAYRLARLDRKLTASRTPACGTPPAGPGPLWAVR